MMSENLKCKALRRSFFTAGLVLGMMITALGQIVSEETGATLYPQEDGGAVVYSSTDDGPLVTVCPGGGQEWGENCFEIKCIDNPRACKDALEGAMSVKMDDPKTFFGKKGVRLVKLGSPLFQGVRKWK